MFVLAKEGNERNNDTKSDDDLGPDLQQARQGGR